MILHIAEMRNDQRWMRYGSCTKIMYVFDKQVRDESSHDCCAGPRAALCGKEHASPLNLSPLQTLQLFLLVSNSPMDQ